MGNTFCCGADSKTLREESEVNLTKNIIKTNLGVNAQSDQVINNFLEANAHLELETIIRNIVRI
jgi:hypothetical protein